jgi:hypothetical protein
MLDVMADMADSYRANGKYGNYGRDPVFWDFCCLASYTGSRIGEYGISKLEKGTPPDGFIAIPVNPDVPEEWRGRPQAFIAEDFTLYDAKMCRVSHSKARRHPDRVAYVIVRFRYDKSPQNFTTRTFTRVASHFCPVKAVLSILKRHHRDLDHRANEPLGYYRARNGRRYAIQGRAMKRYLREVCSRAHPDPNHYLRVNIDQLMSHSFRVTACVALSNAGVKEDEIAYRLRWNSDAVKKYLRDSRRHIHELTIMAMHGAYTSITATAA